MNQNIISLEGMEFYAFHGFYEEERKKGNDFVVDIHITTDFSVAGETDDLSGSVDYVQVFEIIKEEMAVSTKLLERVGQRILDRLLLEFPQIHEVELSVAKKNPPVEGKVAQSKISIKRNNR